MLVSVIGAGAGLAAGSLLLTRLAQRRANVTPS